MLFFVKMDQLKENKIHLFDKVCSHFVAMMASVITHKTNNYFA